MGKLADKRIDKLLVLSYQTGNQKSLALLVKRWHKKLCLQAFWYTKDMESAKDIVQDAWQTIIDKIHSLQRAESFGSWAMTIVTRRAIDHVSKRERSMGRLKTASLTSDDDEQSTGEMYGQSTLLKLRTAIGQLSDDKRIVLTLFYIEEYSLSEISEITGVSVGTVKTRLFRAREKLKKLLKTNDHEKRS